MKTCKSGKKQSRVKGSIAGCSIISLVDNRVYKNPFIEAPFPLLIISFLAIDSFALSAPKPIIVLLPMNLPYSYTIPGFRFVRGEASAKLTNRLLRPM